MRITHNRKRTALLSAIVLATSMAVPLAAQASAQVVSQEAQAVLDRMTTTLQGLQSFSIEAQGSRDEVVALGYKLQHNEHATLVVQRPSKLRAEVRGDLRDRTIVFDSGKLTMYSPDDEAYVKTDVPDTIGEVIGTLLDLGVELPLVDVLYQATAGTLAEQARGGILVGTSTIDGVACDQLAFRQASVDWQIWVEKGARALPRKILITTRYEVGDPQFQATLKWNLNPQISAKTFAFDAPAGAMEIPLDSIANADGGAQ